MTRVLGVHGVGNYQPALSPTNAGARLSQAWTGHLTGNRAIHPSALDLRVAYYAHHLAPSAQQGPASDDPATLHPTAQIMLLAWVAQLGAPAEVAQGYGTLPARQAASWVATQFGLDHRLVNWFVTRFFAEVAIYLTDKQRRTAVRDTVAQMISTHAPRVILAHSLGSVVAYETLWVHPDLHVDLLITLGSPLGMPDVVFDRLDHISSSGRGQRPPGVACWVNLADPGDLVAIPRHLARRFYGIHLDLETPIHAFDFHRVANYLACTATRSQLTPYLAPTGRGSFPTMKMTGYEAEPPG